MTSPPGRTIHQVGVIGLGKVGELVAGLLTDAGFKVQGYDAAARPGRRFETTELDVSDVDALRAALRGVDAVVSCLPRSAWSSAASSWRPR